jgi:hypothetical protein
MDSEYFSDLPDFLKDDYTREDPYILSESEVAAINTKFEVFHRITENFPVSLGKQISKKERDDKNLIDTTLTYGEIDFHSLGEIFDTIRNRYGDIPDGGIFYDLGSGTGKGVIAAAVLHSFEKCVGIEILEGLHDISVQVKEAYEREMPVALAQNPQVFKKMPEVQTILGSFFEVDWTDASFIFANSTCFDIAMRNRISATPVKSGTLGISLTKPLSSSHWKILESIRKRMSWGEATVFIQRKLDPAEIERENREFGEALDSSDTYE